VVTGVIEGVKVVVIVVVIGIDMDIITKCYGLRYRGAVSQQY